MHVNTRPFQLAIQQVLICVGLLVTLSGCSIYRTSFDSDSGRRVSEVLDLIVEKDSDEDLFVENPRQAQRLRKQYRAHQSAKYQEALEESRTITHLRLEMQRLRQVALEIQQVLLLKLEELDKLAKENQILETAQTQLHHALAVSQRELDEFHASYQAAIEVQQHLEGLLAQSLTECEGYKVQYEQTLATSLDLQKLLSAEQAHHGLLVAQKEQLEQVCCNADVNKLQLEEMLTAKQLELEQSIQEIIALEEALKKNQQQRLALQEELADLSLEQQRLKEELITFERHYAGVVDQLFAAQKKVKELELEVQHYIINQDVYLAQLQMCQSREKEIRQVLCEEQEKTHNRERALEESQAKIKDLQASFMEKKMETDQCLEQIRAYQTNTIEVVRDLSQVVKAVQKSLVYLENLNWEMRFKAMVEANDLMCHLRSNSNSGVRYASLLRQHHSGADLNFTENFKTVREHPDYGHLEATLKHLQNLYEELLVELVDLRQRVQQSSAKTL